MWDQLLILQTIYCIYTVLEMASSQTTSEILTLVLHWTDSYDLGCRQKYSVVWLWFHRWKAWSPDWPHRCNLLAIYCQSGSLINIHYVYWLLLQEYLFYMLTQSGGLISPKTGLDGHLATHSNKLERYNIPSLFIPYSLMSTNTHFIDDIRSENTAWCRIDKIIRVACQPQSYK